MRLFEAHHLLLSTLLLALVGCGTKEAPPAENRPAAGAGADAGAQGPSTPADAAAASAFRLGDLLEPFDPPPLDEVIRDHTWVDRPVVDSLVLMRAYQKELPPPELSVAKALALRNDSPEANVQILNTLGRVAPADGAGVDFGSTLVLRADGDLKSTNPLLMSSIVEFDYQGLTSFGLFGFDWRLDKFASRDSVVSWQTSEDRLVDKLVLRDDLTWSDGEPITAHDVEFTFRAIMTNAVILPAIRQGTDQIRAVQAYDDQTIVFFHKEALATNDGNMSFPIIPRHIYAETLPADPAMARSDEHSRLEDNPVVGGAYVLSKRVRGQEFILTRRDGYSLHNGQQVRQQPYFETVRFKIIEDPNTSLLALKAGTIHAQILRPEQWEGQTDGDDFYRYNTKATGPEWTSFHFGWNLKTPYFSDQRVREAMAWAVDYDELLQTLCYGLYQQGAGAFHPDSPMFSPEGITLYHQDLDKAEDLLDEAGWVDSDNDGIRDKEIGGRRVPFRFTLLCANMPIRVQMCALMKESLANIGIECNVKPTEFTVLIDLQQNHKYQAAFGGWGSGADPDTAANIWVTDEGRNYGFYSNKRVDELFEVGRRTFDIDERNQVYQEIHRLLWADQPYTWLFYRNSFYGFSKKLRGYNFSPRGPFHYGPGIGSIYMPTDAP